ncbi:MAG TPA: hypothetical protein PKE31_19720 [Pseudomonadota bacterium]|jgi:hypothetical protein|nr:hypothetical protein [Pseudomonadota bacterium]
MDSKTVDSGITMLCRISVDDWWPQIKGNNPECKLIVLEQLWSHCKTVKGWRPLENLDGGVEVVFLVQAQRLIGYGKMSEAGLLSLSGPFGTRPGQLALWEQCAEIRQARLIPILLLYRRDLASSDFDDAFVFGEPAPRRAMA